MLYQKQVVCHSSWDVIVCGGGPSGISGAIAAARLGMKVLVLERYGVLGGCLTLGNVTTLMGAVAPGSLRDEIAGLLKSPDTETGIDNERAKCVLTELLSREHVCFRLQTPVVDVLVEDGTVRGVFALTQDGIQLFRAGCVVDATGDGLVSALAGCEIMVGRPEDGLVQPSSLMYTIEGVDPDSTLVCRHEED